MVFRKNFFRFLFISISRKSRDYNLTIILFYNETWKNMTYIFHSSIVKIYQLSLIYRLNKKIKVIIFLRLNFDRYILIRFFHLFFIILNRKLFSKSWQILLRNYNLDIFFQNIKSKIFYFIPFSPYAKNFLQLHLLSHFYFLNSVILIILLK